MADLEKREDQKIRECLQQAYGYSDEQLLKKMEEAEKSLEDTDFPGAEERIFQKLMMLLLPRCMSDMSSRCIATMGNCMDLSCHRVNVSMQ